MNRKKRTAALLLVLWSALLCGLCLLLWREVHQQRLNQQLFAAIKRQDTPSALLALAHGANANARDEPQHVPVWQKVWNRLRGRRPPPSKALTPLLLLLQEALKENSKRLYPAG